MGTMYATYGYNGILRTRSRAFDATLYAGNDALPDLMKKSPVARKVPSMRELKYMPLSI